MMFRFFEVAVRRPEARFYKEAEVIWQAVSDKTWQKLKAYSEALGLYCMQIATRLKQRSGWNIFFAEVRAAWIESHKFYHRDRDHSDDYWRVLSYSGYLINTLHGRFISEYNAKHPELDPPLRRSDNLVHRLGELPSFRQDRVVHFKGFDVTPGPSGFVEGELDHLKRRGGIRFDGKDDPTDFEVVLDVRPDCWPKDDEYLGIAALLPTGPESESQETDGSSHGSQEADCRSHGSQKTCSD